jgi:hypothetical protein
LLVYAGSDVRRWTTIVLLGCLACTGSPPPGSETDSSESDSGTSESETGEPGPLLVGEPTIIHHPKQPMIVDVIVELDAPGTGELVHTQDDGVGVFLLEPAAGAAATTLHFRVRGLLPDSTHPLSLTVAEAEGDRTDSWSGDITTNPALPGFIAQFELEIADPSLVSDDLRLFDITPLYTNEPSGLALVDNEGRTRWYVGDVDNYTDLEDVWTGARLRADGSVSFTRRDVAYIMDELGDLHMEVHADDIGSVGFHHDLEELANGNFVILSFAFADVYYEGEGTLHVAGDMLYEFTPEGELVWTWNAFDHLDPQRRRDGFYVPQKIYDRMTGEQAYDWTHGNGMFYIAEDDILLLSMRHQDWVLAIDHQTGEILWRIGDEGDFALVGDEYWFFHQHSPQWQGDGSLLLYDNAVGNPAQPDSDAHSRAVQYALDFNAMTATKLWADDDPTFISALAGDADRMSNGHVLRLDSVWTDEQQSPTASRIHELDPERTPNLVWGLDFPPGRFGYRAVPLTRWVGQPL